MNNFDAIYNDCLAEVQSGRSSIKETLNQHADLSPDLQADLETALQLSAVQKAFDPPPGYIGASRRRLVQEIQSRPRPIDWRHLFNTWGLRLAVALFLVAVFVSSSAVAQAAQVSIPGDPFYPVKTSIEKVRLAVTFNETARAELYINYSQNRMQELQAVILEGRYNYIQSTASEFDADVETSIALLSQVKQYDNIRAEELGDTLNNILSQQTLALTVLQGMVPTQHLAAITHTLSSSSEKANVLQLDILNDWKDDQLPSNDSSPNGPKGTPTAPGSQSENGPGHGKPADAGNNADGQDNPGGAKPTQANNSPKQTESPQNNDNKTPRPTQDTGPKKPTDAPNPKPEKKP